MSDTTQAVRTVRAIEPGDVITAVISRPRHDPADVALEREARGIAHRASWDMRSALDEAAFRREVTASGVGFDDGHRGAQEAASRGLVLGGGPVLLEDAPGSGTIARVPSPAVRAWKENGRCVIGVAPTWRGADALARAGVDGTYTASPFFVAVTAADIAVSARTVLVVDAVTLLGLRRFAGLLRLWERSGCAARGLVAAGGLA